MVQTIYLIAGYAGSGKTTAGELLLEQAGVHARRGAFADAVKDEVAALHAFPRTLCDTQGGKMAVIHTTSGPHTVRELLIYHAQMMKTLRDDPGYWASVLADRMAAAPVAAAWVIHDWRFHAEYERLKECFPDARIVTIRVQRTAVTPISSPTEHELDMFEMQHTIHNDGTLEDLARAVCRVLDV
jgi:hypothetical protein